MNPALKTLISNVEKSEPGKPPFPTIANLLDEINPETGDWRKLAPLLKKHYNFKTTQELIDALRGSIGDLVYEDDFLEIIKKHHINGWVGEYVTHTMGIEPPTAFHFATAMTILGAALQRRICIDRGYFQIYPAMHTLLSGPSATMKTTAARYGYDLLQASGMAFPVMGKTEAYIHNKLFNIEKETGQATGVLYASEIAAFIGEEDWKRSLISYLIKLFDSESNIESGTLARSDETLNEVAVSFLACSNEELLDQAVPKIALSSGFMSRLLVWHCEGTDRVHDTPTIPPDAASWEWLKERLMLTQFIKGEMKLDEEADEWYKFWYTVKWRSHFPKDDRLIPFHKRIRNYILLLAMLLSISDEIGGEAEVTPIIGDIRYIREKHLIQAEAILDWMYTKIPRLYELLGNSIFGKEQIRILSIIKRSGAIKVTELTRKLRFSHRKLTEHLHTLKKSGVIGERDVFGGDGKEVYMIREGVKDEVKD